jgi:transcriptional regulator NrdR family protein
MLCPKCNGKTKIIDGVNDNIENEKYRKRTCVDCGEIFYTTEFVVIADKNFHKKWNESYRLSKVRLERKINKEQNKDKKRMKKIPEGANTCVFCGRVIPEGGLVCSKCDKEMGF